MGDSSDAQLALELLVTHPNKITRVSTPSLAWCACYASWCRTLFHVVRRLTNRTRTPFPAGDRGSPRRGLEHNANAAVGWTHAPYVILG